MHKSSGFLLLLALTVCLLLECNRQIAIPDFDEEKAFTYLKQQCDFGSRVPNSQAHGRCEDYLYDKLSVTSDVCRRQKFTYYDVDRDDTLYLTNIIASYNPDDNERVLLCAHWDCRPWADEEPDSNLHHLPILGANDGASGVAVLLEIAEILKEHRPPSGVDIIFFDGEDYGETGKPDKWILGSKYFVENIGGYRPLYVILLDLVGDADLQIHKEYYSQAYAGWLVQRIWRAATLEKARHFYPDVKHVVLDDHRPFQEIGISAAVIIDMDYDYWHRLSDTPDKCSAQSLGEVGRVVLRLLYDRGL
jgi:glutaminyl-peptide cyclotransferase